MRNRRRQAGRVEAGKEAVRAHAAVVAKKIPAARPPGSSQVSL
jgi:hypothetical protein